MFSKCAIHDKREFSFFAFMRCFECGHVFRFRRSLVDDYNRQGFEHMHGRQFKPAERTDQVYYCPFCLHNFVVGR